MKIETYRIETEAEAKAVLTDLLAKPENQSQRVIDRQCARLVSDPAIRKFFLAEGARMLAEAGGHR